MRAGAPRAAAPQRHPRPCSPTADTGVQPRPAAMMGPIDFGASKLTVLSYFRGTW
eukprot:SAG31_NODE_7009_length_1820_cov_6.134224_1_plen_55_part_10